MNDETVLIETADLFKMFADSTRLAIMKTLLPNNEKSVAEIAEDVGMTQSAVSHHLQLLRSAHLVKFVRNGKQMMYSIADDHVSTIIAQGIEHVCE